MIGGRCRHAHDGVGRQRARAAGPETIDRDAHLAGLVGQVVLNARAGEDDDADRQAVEHLVIALERRGFGMFGPIRLEFNLRHLAVAGPGGGDAFSALRASTMHQDHVRMLGVDLIETVPDRAVIGGIATREGNLRPLRHQHLSFRDLSGGEEIATVDHRGCHMAMVGA